MKNVIAIRREDLSKKGEKRVAVTPKHVRDIVQSGHTVLVQPALHPEAQQVKRAFLDSEFTDVGAHISEDITGAKVIFGLKEIALESIYPDKVYCCFSHTHKGQTKNRQMLQRFVDSRTTLIDYELVVNEAGQRTVTAFTYFAGYAGMIDTLWTVGERLRAEGVSHPLQPLTQSWQHSLGTFKSMLAEIGEVIRTEGTPAELPPFICIFMGDGKTSHGAQEIFNLLPVEHIRPDQIAEIHAHGSRRKVYSCVMRNGDLFKPSAHGRISAATWVGMDAGLRRTEYYANPSEFESNMAPYLPYATVVMNCLIWAPKFPRTITRAIMKSVWQGTHSLLAIGDISCDPDGSVEFCKETWIDDPVYIYHPETEETTMGMAGEGVAVMAVTNLPCEFSKDSSEQFATDLDHLIPNLVKADFEGSLAKSGLDPELKRAVIMWQGEFTPAFAYMRDFLPVNA